MRVALFSTQTETDGLFIIVQKQTGVSYSNQCGGTGCDQQEAEGFLVPVGTPSDLNAVKGWFRRRFGESCWCDGRLATNLVWVAELSDVIAAVPCLASECGKPLALDATRLKEGCEAWVPVQSPFGPGWLTWTNSD